MNITKPGEYKMRDGRKVVVLCTEAPNKHPAVGYFINASGQLATCTWRTDGSYIQPHYKSIYDIVSEWHELVRVDGWVNVYEDGYTSSIWSSKSIADERDAARAFVNTARVACIRVTGVEGEE